MTKRDTVDSFTFPGGWKAELASKGGKSWQSCIQIKLGTLWSEGRDLKSAVPTMPALRQAATIIIIS